MDELLKNAPLVVAFAMAVVVWLVKIVLPGVVDSAIGHAFNKEFEKYKLELESSFELYRDGLSRASAARSLILDREMRYFDEVDKTLAELIPLMHDMADSVSERHFAEGDKNRLLRYLELIPDLKNTLLVYEPYIDERVWSSTHSLVLRLQEDMTGWYDVFEKLSSGTVDGDDIEWSKNTRDAVLHSIAEVRIFQIKYLKGIASQ